MNMSVVLIVYICSGRMCDWTPQYAVEFPSWDACLIEKRKHGNGSRIDEDKAECVPLVRLSK